MVDELLVSGQNRINVGEHEQKVLSHQTDKPLECLGGISKSGWHSYELEVVKLTVIFGISIVVTGI